MSSLFYVLCVAHSVTDPPFLLPLPAEEVLFGWLRGGAAGHRHSSDSDIQFQVKDCHTHYSFCYFLYHFVYMRLRDFTAFEPNTRSADTERLHAPPAATPGTENSVGNNILYRGKA